MNFTLARTTRSLPAPTTSIIHLPVTYVGIYVHKVLIEPDKSLHEAAVDLKKTDGNAVAASEGDVEAKGDEKPKKGPVTLDTKLLWLILGGAVLDNIGSTGMQMAIFPVCFNQVATLGMYYARPSLRVRCGAHLTSFPPRPASPRSMSSDRPSSHKSTRMSTNRCRTTHTSGWLRATCSRSFPAS